jgi:hypothetical protein
MARKAPMGDDGVPFGEDHVIFVAEGIGKGANELEQAVAGRRNVRAVLNVCRRPELLCSDIVAFVKSVSKAFSTSFLFSSGDVVAMSLSMSGRLCFTATDLIAHSGCCVKRMSNEAV